MAKITEDEIVLLKTALNPLIGVQFQLLQIPREILQGFEPSQIGTIIGTLMDGSIPQLHKILPNNKTLQTLGLVKHQGILKDREGYPDYSHTSGKRLELKLLYVDPVGVDMKKPSTRREASARLTQKVTVKNVIPETDVLLVIAYQLKSNEKDKDLFSPTIIDLEVFPMIDCIQARDQRLIDSGGKWFGEYETPAILSKQGKDKKKAGNMIDYSTYGRKESEEKDLNEDTNFGKLKRIPYEPLQRFLQKHGADYMKRGEYPSLWSIDALPPNKNIQQLVEQDLESE